MRPVVEGSCCSGKRAQPSGFLITESSSCKAQTNMEKRRIMGSRMTYGSSTERVSHTPKQECGVFIWAELMINLVAHIFHCAGFKSGYVPKP